MLREYEILIWYSFCSKDVIKSIIQDNMCKSKEVVNTAQDKLNILNHMINTAFYTKKLVCSTDAFQ